MVRPLYAGCASSNVPATPLGPVFGCEEFWPKVYGQHKRQFGAVADWMRLGDEVLKAADESAAEPAKKGVGTRSPTARRAFQRCH